MKTPIFFLSLLLSINHIAVAADGVSPSRLLLSSFANQCPQVVTRNVSATLLNLQSLKSSIEELKNDSNCNGAASLSAVVARYNGLYADFETEKGSVEDRTVLEKKIALYSTLVDDPSIDATTAYFLRTEIIQAQANLVNINQQLSRFQSFSGREARAANQLVSAVDGFFTELQTIQGQACYEKNSAKISNIMSNALLITAAFASGGTSLALAGGAVVTKSVGKYIGDMKENNFINNLNDIEMPTALRCVSQALTDQYCSAAETQSLISERIDANSNSRVQYNGINLLSYQLNSLSKWLVEVYAGSNITSEGDLINREKPELQAELLRQIDKYLDAYGTIKARFFASLDDPAKRSTAIAQSIECLVGLMEAPSLNPCSDHNRNGPQVENPIFTTFQRSLLAYNLFEPGMHTSVPLCGASEDSMPCSSFTSYINRVYRKPLTDKDWEKVLIEANRIINSTRDLVNIERSKTISVDAYAIIVNAKRDLKGETSPYKALRKIVENADRITAYLKGISNGEEGYVDQIANIEKTRVLTTQIIDLVDEGMIPRSIPAEIMPSLCKSGKTAELFTYTDDVLENKSFQITSCISKLLKLQERGTDVYFTKIRNMVSYEMEARLVRNDLGEGVRDLINSTRLDLVQSILNSYSSKDSAISLGELDISLDTAQNNSKETLLEFFDFFKKSILTALESNKVGKSEKYDLCFRILPYLERAKDGALKDIYKNCQSAQFRVYKNGPSIKFSDFVTYTEKKGLRPAKVSIAGDKDLRALFCSYRNYNRANLLLDEQNRQSRRVPGTFLGSGASIR